MVDDDTTRDHVKPDIRVTRPQNSGKTTKELADSNRREMDRIDMSESDTVELSVTMDVGDMDAADRAVLHELAGLFEENFQEIVEKNRDYGFSFLRTGSKLADTAGFPTDSPTRAQVLGLLTRAGDKKERLIENVFGDGSAQVSDGPATTAREAANYWLFMALVLQEPSLAASVCE